MALLIEISVILITGDRDWRFGMVWLVWRGEGQMTSEFIHKEILTVWKFPGEGRSKIGKNTYILILFTDGQTDGQTDIGTC